MRLAIYVPKFHVNVWEPDASFMTFEEFQRRVAALSDAVTLSSAQLFNRGPVFVVEALLHIPTPQAHSEVWNLFRKYADQLVIQGRESVLIVQDNEPTFIQ